MELFSINSETELLPDCRIFVTSEDEARKVLDYYVELGYTLVPELKTQAYYKNFPYLGVQEIVNGRRITAFSSYADKDWISYSTWLSFVGVGWQPYCESIDTLLSQ